MKIYEYKNCSTCKKALKFLDNNNIEYKKIAIRETPPSKSELKKMLKYMEGNIKKLFNTSGLDYRSMKLKDKIDTMTQEQAFDLLCNNGNLVKRPFLISKNKSKNKDKGKGIVGFKEEIWNQLLKE